LRRYKADPSSMARIYMSVEEVVAVAETGRRAGATECLFTLGVGPDTLCSPRHRMAFNTRNERSKCVG